MSRKYLKTVMILILACLPAIFDAPKTLGLEEGNSFIYEIKRAGYYVEYGNKSTLINGYHFGTLECSIGTKVNATATEVEEFGNTEFIFRVSNISRIGYSTANWFDIVIVDRSFMPLHYAFEIVENYYATSEMENVLYQIRPYVHLGANNYLNQPETLGEDIGAFFSKESYPDIESNYRYHEENEILIFESLIGGDIQGMFGDIFYGVNSNHQSDISFENNLHFAVNKETGIVYGFGLQGWVEGVVDNIRIKYSVKIDYTLEGYDLDSYSLGTFRDFTVKKPKLWIILVPSIAVPIVAVATTVILVQTQKRKRKNEQEKKR